MTAYVHPRWTRIAVLPTVAALNAPTLTEIAAGTEINRDVLIDGLAIERSTETADATPWRSDLVVERVTRYSMTADLVGLRRTQGDTESLWNLCELREPSVLIVRRGVPAGTAWAAGQVVEAMRFRFGKRGVIGSSGGAVTFRVHLAISEDDDAAVVAS